ncbi:reverse transcriptase domain-containing protein [Tanacetum coccineum]|uniref:Reverse transcriptase domain-containing protein n=1 Tax=Tanacetum coccineum TaxID=301880 RepID=A0ABQ5CIQ8_9ASTR
MADQRTMAELIRAPIKGYAEAIVVPPILAEHFELKHSLINMMTSDQFFGLEKDNPHDRIRWFNKITSTIKYKDVPNSAIKLMLFPFSLAGVARRWLEKEPPRSILTWEDLVSKFINEFFPPSRTTNLRNEISNFEQRPHHGFTELHQLDTFYNALNLADQDSLNSAVDGNLLERRTQDVLTIIENKSKCLAADGNTFRDNIQGYVSAAAVNYNQGNSGYRPPSVANQIRPPGFAQPNVQNNQNRFSQPQGYNRGNNFKQDTSYQAPIQQNQVIPLSELEKIKKINEVNIKAMQAQINNVKNELRNEMQTSIQASMSNQTNELKNMMASFFQMNTASSSGSGSLPSNTIANPKGELKAITTRSGLVLDGPSVPMPPPFINPEEDERAEETLTDPELAEYTIKVLPPLVQKAKPTSLKNYVVHKRDPLHPNIPYPSRMHQEKQQEKDEVQIHKFWQMFKQIHINISLVDALILIPKYQKMLKSLLSNKEKLLELANTPLNENCSTVILKKLPEKLGDPGKFLIPCGFSELKCKALADLGNLYTGWNCKRCLCSGWKVHILLGLKRLHGFLEVAAAQCCWWKDYNCLKTLYCEALSRGKNDLKRKFLWRTRYGEDNQYPDAKSMFAAIETRFGGNEATKKTQKTLLKQQTALSSSSTNDANTAYPQVSAASTSGNAVSPQVYTVSVSDNTVYAFMVKNPNGSNVLHQNLKQIHEDDLEAMDLKWQLSLLIGTLCQGMQSALKTQNDSFAFVHEFKQEMHVDLKYVESIEKEVDELEFDKAKFSNMYDMLLQECVSNDVMCFYLHSLSDLDAHIELQYIFIKSKNVTVFHKSLQSKLNIFKQVEYKGVPPPLSGDYTPRAQEDIDDSFDGELGTVSNANSTVYSTCQSNDSDGEQGTVSDHSVNDDSIPVPSRPPVTPSPIPSYNRQNWNQRMERDLEMEREAAFQSKRVVHTDVRQATPAWTNSNRVNKANQFTPRPKQLNNIRPNFSTASRTIKNRSRVNLQEHVNFSMHEVKFCFTTHRAHLEDYQDSLKWDLLLWRSKGIISGKRLQEPDENQEVSHLNFKNLNKLVKDNLVRGNLPKFQNDHTLVAMSRRKATQGPPVAKVEYICNNTLHTLHKDLFGPSSVRSTNHASFCLVNTDDFQGVVLESVGKGNTTGVLVMQETPQQNGVAERIKRTLIEAAAYARLTHFTYHFFGQKQSILFFFFFLQTFQQGKATKPQNKTLIALFATNNPYYIRPFGCHGDNSHTLSPLGKFDGKSDEGFLVGYSVNSKAFRVYNLVTKRVETEELKNSFEFFYFPEKQLILKQKCYKTREHSAKKPLLLQHPKAADDIMVFRKELDALA